MSAVFAGAIYESDEDDERLAGQLLRIYATMKDSGWRTLSEIEAVTGDPPASISAQLRHLRKKRFGAFVVEKRPRGMRSNGLFEYRVLPAGSPSVVTAKKSPVKARNPFLAGVMYAARLVAKSSNLSEAKAALVVELRKSIRSAT